MLWFKNDQDGFGKFISENLPSMNLSTAHERYADFVLDYIFRKYKKEYSKIGIQGIEHYFRDCFSAIKCTSFYRCKDLKYTMPSGAIQIVNQEIMEFL